MNRDADYLNIEPLPASETPLRIPARNPKTIEPPDAHNQLPSEVAFKRSAAIDGATPIEFCRLFLGTGPVCQCEFGVCSSSLPACAAIADNRADGWKPRLAGRGHNQW